MTSLNVPPRRIFRSGCVAGFLTISLGLAGCSGSAQGTLGELQQVAAACPDEPLNSVVQTDGSGSALTEEITSERLAVIEHVVQRTIVCSGHLSVRAFSSSSGATVDIFNGDLTLNAPTQNARLRQTPEAVETAMAEIAASYEPALALLPRDGSDIISTFRLFAEQAAQFPEYRLEAYLLSDGAQNLGALQVPEDLTVQRAQLLAEQQEVPTLPRNSLLTIAGVGRVNGDALSSGVVEGMVALYTAIAEKTGAGEILVVTDLAVSE